MMYCPLRDRVEVHRMDAKDAASVAALLDHHRGNDGGEAEEVGRRPHPGARKNYRSPSKWMAGAFRSSGRPAQG